MAHTTDVFPGSPFRTLVLESDDAEELAVLVARAIAKGWSELANGTAPASGQHAAWLVKPTAENAPVRA